MKKNNCEYSLRDGSPCQNNPCYIEIKRLSEKFSNTEHIRLGFGIKLCHEHFNNKKEFWENENRKSAWAHFKLICNKE